MTGETIRENFRRRWAAVKAEVLRLGRATPETVVGICGDPERGRAVIFRRQGGEWTITGKEGWADKISFRAFVRREGLAGAAVGVALPAERFWLLEQELPDMPPTEMAATARWHIEMNGGGLGRDFWFGYACLSPGRYRLLRFDARSGDELAAELRLAGVRPAAVVPAEDEVLAVIEERALTWGMKKFPLAPRLMNSQWDNADLNAVSAALLAIEPADGRNLLPPELRPSPWNWPLLEKSVVAATLVLLLVAFGGEYRELNRVREELRAEEGRLALMGVAADDVAAVLGGEEEFGARRQAAATISARRRLAGSALVALGLVRQAGITVAEVRQGENRVLGLKGRAANYDCLQNWLASLAKQPTGFGAPAVREATAAQADGLEFFVTLGEGRP